MRQKKAKQIKRMIFGDHSYKIRKYIKDKSGAIREVGLRGIYQRTKKAFAEGRSKSGV